MKNIMKNLNILTGAVIALAVLIPGFVIGQTLERNTEIDTRDVQLEIDEIIDETEESVDSTIEETTDIIETADTTENTRVISENLDSIKRESDKLENDVRADVKKTIDKSILDIRSEIDIEAYELQRIVNEARDEIYHDLDKTLESNDYNNTESITELQNRVKENVSRIKQDLERQTGVDLAEDNSNQEIDDKFSRYLETVVENARIINEREGELLQRDTDGDGLSDYDEKFIYNTDPNNSKTIDGELTDGEKVERGIDPTSTSSEQINYSDPREDRTSYVSKIHNVESVELVTDEETQQKRLRMSGTGLPNSYVTVFIYSNPVIATVKTDERGQWTYTLDRELENGEHEVYVATVDNTGRLVAKSERIPLTQTAEAAALGVFGIGEPTNTSDAFNRREFILIIISIILLAIIVTLVLAGSKKNEDVELDVKEFSDKGDNQV